MLITLLVHLYFHVPFLKHINIYNSRVGVCLFNVTVVLINSFG